MNSFVLTYAVLYMLGIPEATPLVWASTMLVAVWLVMGVENEQ